MSGLHRQSELTIKEPFRISLDSRNGKQILDVVGLGGSFVPAEAGEDQSESVEIDLETSVKEIQSARLV